MSAPMVFVVSTTILWLIGMLRMGYRREARALNSFILGMFVMSFAGIWISLIGSS